MKERDLEKNIGQNKWLTFTGKRLCTELLDDIENTTTDALDEMLKVYRYKDDPISGSTGIAEISSEPFSGKEICMKVDTYIYSDNLFLTGDLNKRYINLTNGTWRHQETLNDYFAMKGVKIAHCHQRTEGFTFCTFCTYGALFALF